MKICIDPGHGGHDPGANGPTGLDEAPVALTISLKLAEELAGEGIQTKLTRSTDVYVELGYRCQIANDWGADYFVSIHLNSNGSTAKGIETLYTTQNGKALAEPIQQALIDTTGEVDRGLKERNDLYVLNGTAMPAVLVEVGFISNPGTEKEFRDGEYLDALAEAIAEGIIHFLNP